MSSLSVIIVAWHSERHLRTSLPALASQLGPDDELIVIDNASPDRSGEIARELVQRALVVTTPANLGFAGGANAGAAMASGDLLVFLNPDGDAAPDFAEAIRLPLEEGRDWCAWMGLVTSDGGRKVNTAGNAIHFTGISWAGMAGAPVERAPAEPCEVPALSGACLAIPREVFRSHGGFAESYFMYYEDTDLSLRLRLAGGRIGIEPRARFEHDYAFHGGAAKWRRLEANRWATLLRTYPSPLLLLLAPALVATELALHLIAWRGGWLRAKLEADAEVLRGLSPLLRARRRLKGQSRVGPVAFSAWLTPDLDSLYLPGRVASLAVLRGGLRGYWRIVRGILRLAS